jgi:hypothetical protein
MTSTTYPIPRGWRRVVRGRTRKGDKAWETSVGGNRFGPVTFIGWDVRDFLCVIRRVKEGGAK